MDPMRASGGGFGSPTRLATRCRALSIDLRRLISARMYGAAASWSGWNLRRCAEALLVMYDCLTPPAPNVARKL